METDKLKPGWKIVQFGDVVRNVNLVEKEPLSAGIEKVVGLEHLDPGDLHIRRCNSIEDDTSFSRKFLKGQTLFGKRRSYQRKVAFAEFEGICSGDILTFETKNPDVLLPELLPFICQTNSFFEYALGTSAGSLSPRTSWNALKEFKFPLPPLEEQRRMAEILWAADETVEKVVKLKHYIVESRIVLFKNLSKSKGLKVKKISDLGTIVTGSTPSTQNISYYNHQDYMFVSPADIFEEKYVYKTEKMVSIDGFQVGRPILKDAVMVVCIGSTLGKVAMASDECITNQQINSIICNNENNSHFVYHLLLGMEKLFKNVASCTALPIINKTQFSNMVVKVPEKVTQLRIVSQLKYFEDAEAFFKKHLSKLEFTYKKLREELIAHV